MIELPDTGPWKRIERIGNAILLLGDCLEMLPYLPKVDAVITDPPYGINWKPRVNHQDQPWIDDVQFDPAPWLSIGERHLFWGAQYFADKLPRSEAWGTWIKRPINHDFSKDGRSYATTELAWTDWGKARFIVLVWDGGMRAGLSDNRTFCHPSQKPVEVMEWCLPDDCAVVLDPYMGSATTGIACQRADRQFIGIEIEPKYFDIACERITNAQRQQRMFE